MGFFVSQLYCKNKGIDTTYSIGLGLVFYSAFYLYFLFYNNDLLPFFNNILIYIVSVDLLLTAFYSYKVDDTEHFEEQEPYDLPEELQMELPEEVQEELQMELPEEDQEELLEEIQEDDVSDIIEMETEEVIDEVIDDSLSTIYKEFEEATEEASIEKPKRGRKKKVTIGDTVFTD